MKTYCISHVKDVDGIGAAAIVEAATKAEVALSDYNTLIQALSEVPTDTRRFVLCDLGGDNSNLDEFVSKLAGIATKAETIYIDHHFLSDTAARKLRKAGVRLIHDESECSSMLAYYAFREQLPERARLIALMGAVTDYMDGSPKASAMMEQADRQFVLLEATMLAYAIAKKGGEKGYPESIVRELSKMKPPHEIEGVPRLAVEQLADVVKLGDEVKRKGRKLGNLAYMITSQHSTGNVAKLLIGAFEVPVGVALKQQEKGWYEVSLRGTSESRVHLGKAIGKVSSRLGGSGGGHRKAAGCRIPVTRMKDLLDQLAKIA